MMKRMMVCGAMLIMASFVNAITIETSHGKAELERYVPKSKYKVAAVIYTTDYGPAKKERCPIEKINERGYAVLTLDCSKLKPDAGMGRAVAIKAVQEQLKNDPEIDATKVGVLCDLVQKDWDLEESNWMKLIDSYDEKGWNADPSKVAKTRKFKVLAWNIEGRQHTPKETATFVKFVKTVNPDVVLISENYGRYDDILAGLGGDWNGKRFSMNVIMYSRWQIVDSYAMYEGPWNYLDPTGPFNFGLTELDVNGQRVRACPLWMNWEHGKKGKPRFSNPRKDEMKGILKSVKAAISESEDIPIIIGGDFNGPTDPHDKMMAKAGFIDSYAALHPDLDVKKAYTWKSYGKRAGKQEYIDFIYYKGSKLKLVDSEIFHSAWHEPFEFKGVKYDSFPSDHGFVLSTFDLTMPQPPPQVFLTRGEFEVKKDIKYRDEKECVLDLSLPKGVKDFPTVVWFHGGGLTKGNRHFIDIDRNAVAIAAVDYRLMPNVGPGECLDDAAKAAAWVKENIASFGGDPKRIFISGHSAGGYLTSMLCLDKRWLEKYNCSPYDFAGYFSLSGQVSKHFAIRKYFGDKSDSLKLVIDEWAPLNYLSEKTPPLFLSLGDRRIEWPLRVEENELMYRTLKRMGNKNVEFKSHLETHHGSCRTPSMGCLMDFISRH
ncbi:MAG: carboxylesterase family protein [Kiritimatiellae bacterium]|nr:carboxylesterase family protein [Kiritimatiellia bacterium]